MANSITARFNDDCKVFVSMSNDTTVDKAVIIDAEGNETEIGGGGGGDFSTAEVTLVNASDVYLPIAYINEEYNISGSMAFRPPNENMVTAILYKGVCYLNDFSVQSVSGDITYDDDLNMYIITGDCTLTYSNIS